MPISNAEIKARTSNLKTYYLILWKLGPAKRDNPEDEERLQIEHLQHLFALRSASKIVLTGPLEEPGELRGISILDAESLEEARDYVQSDLIIRAGHTIAEIYPWLGTPGDMLT